MASFKQNSQKCVIQWTLLDNNNLTHHIQAHFPDGAERRNIEEILVILDFFHGFPDEFNGFRRQPSTPDFERTHAKS
ncbi:MAG: hypothetical protein ACYCYP_01840 [Leptospirales bacterium]